MSNAASLIARLAAEGVSPELLGDVAMALASAQAATQAIEKRRAADRDRQSKRRESHVMSRDVTGHAVTPQTSQTETTDASFSELKQDPPSPPKGGSVPQGTATRKPRNRALPNGWQPGERSEKVRIELGRPVSWMLSTATEMRVWAESTGQVRADWDACHDGWMRREAKREGERPSQRAGPSSSPKTHHVALNRLADRLRIPDEPDRTPSRFADHGPVIDHAGDGQDDRGLFEPARGDAGQSSEASRLRVVSSRWG